MPPRPLSDGDDPAWPDDAVEVGRILGAWGVKGAIRVKAFSTDPQALFSSRRWFVAPPPSTLARPGATEVSQRLPGLLRITQAREQGDDVVATCQELSDRDAAQALAGARVFVGRGSFPTPDEGEFYWVDLIGLDVVNREGTPMGEVLDLVQTGPHCVLRLSAPNADGQERMIPFVAAYVDSVDLAARRIVVDWSADY